MNTVHVFPLNDGFPEALRYTRYNDSLMICAIFLNSFRNNSLPRSFIVIESVANDVHFL